MVSVTIFCIISSGLSTVDCGRKHKLMNLLTTALQTTGMVVIACIFSNALLLVVIRRKELRGFWKKPVH
jgi:hypothetical protein